MTSHRRREVPLAVIMVALTTLTLWSLGQSLVVEQSSANPTSAHAPVAIAIAGAPSSRR